MKIIIALIALVSFWNAALGQQPIPPTTAVNPVNLDIKNSDVIALVSFSKITRNESTNAAGKAFESFTIDAKLERSFKGNPPGELRIEVEAKADQLALDNYFRRPRSNLPLRQEDSRWVVFLMKTRDGYAVTDAQSLGDVYGTGTASRVIWRSQCLSVDELEGIVKKSLAQK